MMNQCLDSNTRVSISKFEEILKYIFIRMNSNMDSNNNENNRYNERTLISDIKRINFTWLWEKWKSNYF